ncbi:hypothetical protein AAFF_G00212170 [Aldrovandia affinis]|uniref:Uncharacterized protein n=1 Tax=Aldrovandia affinis TaxID=143900 RepID=A0AAD7RGX7_9TELE|nr:hypothetical protein AAFF_G00212170 [Aldrovandia affinis]
MALAAGPLLLLLLLLLQLAFTLISSEGSQAEPCRVRILQPRAPASSCPNTAPPGETSSSTPPCPTTAESTTAPPASGQQGAPSIGSGTRLVVRESQGSILKHALLWSLVAILALYSLLILALLVSRKIGRETHISRRERRNESRKNGSARRRHFRAVVQELYGKRNMCSAGQNTPTQNTPTQLPPSKTANHRPLVALQRDCIATSPAHTAALLCPLQIERPHAPDDDLYQNM